MRPASLSGDGSMPLTPPRRMGSAEKRSCSGDGQACFPCLGSTSKGQQCFRRQVKMLLERMLTNSPKQKHANHAEGVQYAINSFVSEEGRFTARREQAGHKRGGWYWKAYRKQHGKLSSRYLGKSETVTLARLQTVAQALADVHVETAPDNDADEARPSAQAAASWMRSDSLTPLLATKLHRPLPRAHLVRRPQLAERLTQGVMGPLTLVSAPAGFGKTTLLAQWLAESGMPVAWLSLEPGDNEP